MEKDEIKTLETQQVNGYKLFRKIIRYIQRNVGAFTFITTSVIAVGGVVIRFILYLIEYGKITYYNISPLLIDVSGENILYDLFVKGVFVLIFILLNFIPYALWKGNKKIGFKLVISLIIALSPAILYLVFNMLRGIRYSINNIGIIFLFGFVLGVILFWLGLYNGIYEYLSKRPQKFSKDSQAKKTKKIENRLSVFKKSVSFLLIILAIESILFIYAGWSISASQKQFKIITNDNNAQYAVIYENSEKYVITRCEIKDNAIVFVDIDTQQEIDRDGVEFKWQRITRIKERT